MELNEEQKKELDELGENLRNAFIRVALGLKEIYGEPPKASHVLLSLNEHLDVWTVDGKVCVDYRNGEVKSGAFLVTEFGSGNTFEKACDDYLSKIQGKTLVFNAYSANRREVTVIG